MSTTLELETAVVPRQTGALVVKEAAPNIAGMLQAVIEKGVTGENVKALESLVTLYERMEARDAEKAFAQAFNALQSEMPRIQAKKPVHCKNGDLKYKFAPFEEIMEQVRPLLLKHGFSVSFSMRFGDGRLTEICTLQHVGGHSKSNEFAVRIGSGPPGASESQADGAAATYAKRFALCNALNVIVEADDDARVEGGSVTAEQADELERRVALTNSNKAAFLKLAGAQTYREIKAGKYEVLDNFLRMKEAKGR